MMVRVVISSDTRTPCFNWKISLALIMHYEADLCSRKSRSIRNDITRSTGGFHNDYP